MNKKECELLISQAKEMLKEAKVDFFSVEVYAGCSEQCGEMPRVLIKWDDPKKYRKNDYRVPICYHLKELKESLDAEDLCFVRTVVKS